MLKKYGIKYNFKQGNIFECKNNNKEFKITANKINDEGNSTIIAIKVSDKDIQRNKLLKKMIFEENL